MRLVRAGYAVLLAASMTGLAIAVWAHVESLRGLDPRTMFPRIWLLQIPLNLLLAPLVIAFFRKGVAAQMREFPPWLRAALISFGVYYSIHFYVFMKLASDEVRADWTWRMFSAGWMALFAVPAAYYWTMMRRQTITRASK